MPTLEYQGRQIELNEEGFLADPDDWTEEIALVLAKDQEDLDDLSPDHWAVIRFIRAYYLEKKLAPMVRAICKTTNLQLRQIYDLFPSGPAKGACKLAGLPKPDGCV
jgi:TusE/DsrC/DsvC family sulfur relay protein